MNGGDSSQHIPSRRKVVAAGAIIILAGLLSYLNSFAGPFVRDDVPSIVQNSTIRHLENISLVLSPPQNSLVGGRPVVNLSYAINYAISGTSVWSYHALNLLIHLFAGLILFGLVRRMLLSPPLQRRFGQAALPLAIAVAVLWVVHPLQTAAVMYLSERAESLMGLFYFLTLYCFIRGTESRGQRSEARRQGPEDRTNKPEAGGQKLEDEVQKRTGIWHLASGCWLLASVISCWLGVLAKEVIVSAPLIVLLYDRTFVSGSFREAWRKHRWLHGALFSSWLLIIRLLAGITDRGVGYGLGVNWWTYALTECRVVVRYLGLAFWPHPLLFDHGTPWAKNAAEAAPYACILAFLIVGTAIALHRRPALGFAGAWVFLILAPTSSVVPIPFVPMAEHRMYLSLAAIVALFVIGIYSWIGQKSLILFSILAVILALTTLRRNEDYHTELALWTDNMHKLPQDAYGHAMVGISLLHIGRTAEATAQFQQAEKLDQTMDRQFYDIGMEMWKNGQPTEAIKYFKVAVRMKPGSVPGHYDLGVIETQLGMVSDAIGEFQEALSIDPNFAPARAYLSHLQSHDVPKPGQKEPPEAIK